ncbi:MAG: hypothetical protein FWG65_02305, partial [Turicibacter sp.]|nr:hypothetical protein [Turicibacter sp.]
PPDDADVTFVEYDPEAHEAFLLALEQADEALARGEFTIFIDPEQIGHEDFAIAFERAMTTLAQTQFANIEEESWARQEMLAAYFDFERFEQPIDQTSVWVIEVLNNSGHFSSHEPPLTNFYRRQIDGQLFQGHLSRGSFGANPSQTNRGLWDFFVVYTGEIFSHDNFPTPIGVHPDYGLAPEPAELAVRKQNLHEVFYTLLPHIEEWLEERVSNIPMIMADGSVVTDECDLPSTIFVSDVQEFFWNKQSTFRPLETIMYSRIVDGVLYQGQLTNIGLVLVVLDNGLDDIMGTYAGTLFAVDED